MSVLRRLYNVAYGRVRIWQAGDPDPDPSLDSSPMSERPVRNVEPPPVVDAPPPTPSEPRQRRL